MKIDTAPSVFEFHGFQVPSQPGKVFFPPETTALVHGMQWKTRLEEMARNLKGEVKKGEMAQPIFVETGWKGSITLGDREWQVQRLESKPTFNFNRQVWFFMTASVITQPPPAPQSKMSPAAPTVAIFGQVLRQGKYTFRPGMTLSDLIQQAQGISKQAGSQAEVQRGPRNSLIKLPNGGVFRFQKGDVITIKESPAKVSASTASGFPQQSDADVKARQRLILQDWLAKRQELMAEFDQPELSKIKPTPPGYTDLDAFWHQQVQRAQETLKSMGLEVMKPPRL